MFKIEEKYKLFSEPKKTFKFDNIELKDNILIYLYYDKKSPKIYKEINKCTHSTDNVCSKCATLIHLIDREIRELR